MTTLQVNEGPAGQLSRLVMRHGCCPAVFVSLHTTEHRLCELIVYQQWTGLQLQLPHT